MRVAVIDCGTNTVRLLIADEVDNELVEVVRDLKFVRLGQGVDATGAFHPDALKRTFAALDEFAAVIDEHEVDHVRFLATSAVRDVDNREEFRAGVHSRLGVDPDVIEGEEEAELSFLGALLGGELEWAESPAGGDDDGVKASSVLVTDIGGGSTELIRGTVSGQISAAASLDVGSVRLRERFLLHDPPLPAEVAGARAFIDEWLLDSGVPLDHAATWIGVAGTATSLSGMNLGLTVYDRAKVHNSVMEVGDIVALSEHLLRLTVAETIVEYPSLQPMRAEVICGGALITAQLAAHVGRPMLVRETDILDGAALKLVRS